MNMAFKAVIDSLFSKSLDELIEMGMPDPTQLVHTWAWCSAQQLIIAEEFFYCNPVAVKTKGVTEKEYSVYDVLLEQLTLAKIIRDFGGEFGFMHAHHYDSCWTGSLSWVVCQLENGDVSEDDCVLLLTRERARQAHIDSLQSKEQWLQDPLSLLNDTRWMRKFVRKDLSPRRWLWDCLPKVSDLLIKTSNDPYFHPREAERVAQKLFMLGFEPDDGPFLSSVRNIFCELDELLAESPGSKKVVEFFLEHRLLFRYV